MLRTKLRLNSTPRAIYISSTTHFKRLLVTPSSAATSFSQALAKGPSFDDFLRGDKSNRVALGRVDAPRLPSYLKTQIPSGSSFAKIKKDLRGLGLHTVCEEARCPNIGECWSGDVNASGEVNKRKATATIMVHSSYLAVI